MSTSSDDDVDYTFDLQWIFHFECFHYLKNIFIKEFSAYCIQTNDIFTCYIKSPPALQCEADFIEKETYARQTKRHGFNWDDGDIYIEEFYDTLLKKIPPKHSQIFAFDRTVLRYFDWSLRKRHGYNNISIMENIPIVDDASLACVKNHSKTHCAQMKLVQKLFAMRPALVPYYVPSVVYNFGRHVQYCKQLEIADNKSIKWGEHDLKPPFYTSLCKVNLYKNDCCQHSLARKFERNLGFSGDNEEDNTPTPQIHDTSSETAGTVDSEVHKW